MSDTGRYYVKDLKTGRVFCVEPIGDPHIKWGDINPATKELEGDYGKKHSGYVKEDESIITKENGYDDIVILGPGGNPEDYINKILKK